LDCTNDQFSTKVQDADAGAAADPAAGTDYAPASGIGGVYSLKTADIFNILCVPDLCARDDRSGPLAACLEYCHERRAMLIVDPPSTWTVDQAVSDTLQNPQVTGSTENAVTYFPWIQAADPAANGDVRSFPPSGSVAGAWVRTDMARGVFKAPAGESDGILTGVSDLSEYLNDPDIGQLNPLAVNCLRRLPVIGPVIWGARTMQGADILAEDTWRYISVRRLTLMIEESLYRGLRWVVFEPNDEPLWSTIRVNVGTFMDTLFRQGAFQGQTAREAYLVQCDAANNPQADIDRGIVNVLVGFAPLKPAEFVFVHIKQISPLFAA
jgi:phage tail sheath protein FI